jgi:hypothetical protein
VALGGDQFVQSAKLGGTRRTAVVGTSRRIEAVPAWAKEKRR